MKYIDLDDMDKLPGVHLKTNDTFSFHCHPGVGCFNLCCRNLNLFLYPYDVIRLKNNLDLSSDQFLDQYVDVVLRGSSAFPEVLLRMADNNEKTCPFVIKSGCSVYPDRPDTCRTFPLEQGLVYDGENKNPFLIQFYRPPDFCLGQNESRIWTSKAWVQDQNAVLYNRMTAQWADLKRLFQVNPWGKEGWENPQAKMAFMATYNIDRFRDFVFSSSFLKRYKLKSERVNKIRTDDVELLKLGFDWVRLFVWGIKSRHIRLR